MKLQIHKENWKRLVCVISSQRQQGKKLSWPPLELNQWGQNQ